MWQSLLSPGGSTAANSSLLDAIRKEGSLSHRVGELTSMLHVFALSTVLQLDIVSLCPSTSLIHRSILTARINPLRTTECCTFSVPDSCSPLVILWSRDVPVFPPEAMFKPNHVVPLFHKNDEKTHQCSRHIKFFLLFFFTFSIITVIIVPISFVIEI